MSRKKKPEAEPEETPEGNPAAGGCVLLALTAGAVAGVWAVSPMAAVLTIWAVGVGAIWWAARRGMSDMCEAPPPPPSGRPSCSECAGHELISVTPSAAQKGMLIYKTATPGRPNHTHIHVQETP